MRALWSDRQNCSHNVSQKVKRIRRFSDSSQPLLRASVRHEQRLAVTARATKTASIRSAGRGLFRTGVVRQEPRKPREPRKPQEPRDEHLKTTPKNCLGSTHMSASCSCPPSQKTKKNNIYIYVYMPAGVV